MNLNSSPNIFFCGTQGWNNVKDKKHLKELVALEWRVRLLGYNHSSEQIKTFCNHT